MNKAIEKSRPNRNLQELLETKNKFPIKPVLMGAGLLIIIAAILDISGVGRKKTAHPSFNVKTDLQNIVLSLDRDRYTDVDHLFSITIPPKWRVQTPPESTPYDVIFVGPNQTDINIIATKVDYNSLPELLEEINRRERDNGIATDKVPFFYKGIPAVKRIVKLRFSTALAIDFVKDHVAHHILFSAPPEYYDQYEPIFMELLNTYKPAGTEKNTP